MARICCLRFEKSLDFDVLSCHITDEQVPAQIAGRQDSILYLQVAAAEMLA
jgi:hypothetical protein